MRRVRRVPRQTSYESPMQTAVASYLDGLANLYPMELAWDHPPNEGSRDAVFAAKLKGQGVKAGQPDLSLYLAGPALVLAELKAMDGKISGEQWGRMAVLDNLGFDCWIIAAATPGAAVDAVARLLHLATNPTDHPRLTATVTCGNPYMMPLPIEGRMLRSFYLWNARNVLRLGKKSIISIIDGIEGKSG